MPSLSSGGHERYRSVGGKAESRGAVRGAEPLDSEHRNCGERLSIDGTVEAKIDRTGYEVEGHTTTGSLDTSVKAFTASLSLRIWVLGFVLSSGAAG